MRNTYIAAIKNGLFDIKLDKSWESNAFQFYIGDIANAVPYARKFQADLPI